MRRKLLLLLALTLALPLFTSGCKQRCFLTEADHNYTTTTLLDGMVAKPDLAYEPLTPRVDAPPTLNHLDRKVRFLSLAEAVANALEHGTVGQIGGGVNDVLGSFQVSTGGGPTPGFFNNNSDAIRVLSLNPARSGQNI